MIPRIPPMPTTAVPGSVAAPHCARAPHTPPACPDADYATFLRVLQGLTQAFEPETASLMACSSEDGQFDVSPIGSRQVGMVWLLARALGVALEREAEAAEAARVGTQERVRAMVWGSPDE